MKSLLPPIVAGFVTVLVGLTSSLPIVFQAAGALNISAQELGSWIWSLQIGMGLTCIFLSLYYRMPIVTAFSTSGAALLATALVGLSLPEAIGAFLVSALLLTLSGVTGIFEKVMDRIPIGIASAMLAGILARFGMDAFLALNSQFLLVLIMAFVYLLLKRWIPRYAIMFVLLVGIAVAGKEHLLRTDQVALGFTLPQFTWPIFSLRGIFGVAIPLYFVTMAGQNAAGVAIIRAFGYSAPVSPLISVTGLANLLLAPFGGFALNLAAISAAICMGEEAHPDREKRYWASIAAGIFHLSLAAFGITLASLFSVFPKELVIAIAGFALLGAIGNSLATAMKEEKQREASLITFLVTASGLTLFGVSSAFWGLVAGALASFILTWQRNKITKNG